MRPAHDQVLSQQLALLPHAGQRQLVATRHLLGLIANVLDHRGSSAGVALGRIRLRVGDVVMQWRRCSSRLTADRRRGAA
jgi:hypothetical protein